MIKNYLHWQPQIHETAYIAESADIIGRVWIGKESSVWYQAVLRGDVHDIIIGDRSNIQDHCMLHTTEGLLPCVVGNDVTIGHRVLMHSCEIQDRCLVGMGSIILDRAILEEGCFLGAGSLVTPGKVLKGGYLYAGSPARQVRPLTDKEKEHLAYSAIHYVDVFNNHLKSG